MVRTGNWARASRGGEHTARMEEKGHAFALVVANAAAMGGDTCRDYFELFPHSEKVIYNCAGRDCDAIYSMFTTIDSRDIAEQAVRQALEVLSTVAVIPKSLLSPCSYHASIGESITVHGGDSTVRGSGSLTEQACRGRAAGSRGGGPEPGSSSQVVQQADQAESRRASPGVRCCGRSSARTCVATRRSKSRRAIKVSRSAGQ